MDLKDNIDNIPQELRDKILIESGFLTCIATRNDTLIKKCYKPEIHKIRWAISSGNLDAVKWIYEKTNKTIYGCTGLYITVAKKIGCDNIVEYLKTVSGKCNIHTECEKGIYTQSHIFF
jgi:hypothetical protein